MIHLVQFKFLLLLTFAVWMHHCETFDSKIKVLSNCCEIGRNHSAKFCDVKSYDFTSIKKSLQIECKSKFKYCCRKQREKDDCNEGIKAAQKGSDCPGLSIKYSNCYKACNFGIRMAKRGDDCNEPLKGEELLAISAAKTCCEQEREKFILYDDEDNKETDEASSQEDDYDEDENGDFIETTTLGALEAPTIIEQKTEEPSTTTQSSIFERTTTTEAITTTTEATTTTTTEATTTTTTEAATTTTTKSSKEDYDEVTTAKPPGGIEYLSLLQSSAETREVDTATTTRRPPPQFRLPATSTTLASSSSEEDTTTTTTTTAKPQRQPSSNSYHRYNYERPQNGKNYIQAFYTRQPSYRRPMAVVPKNFQTQESCDGTRYCDHICTVINGFRKCSCYKGYELQHDERTCLIVDGSRLPPDEIRKVTKKCQSGHYLNDFGDCQDIDECKIQNNGCGDKAYCRNTIGSYECIPTEVCKAGYRFNEDARTCEDINECDDNPRICYNEQVCNNTVGSYTCTDSYSELIERCEELALPTQSTTLPTTTTTTTTTPRSTTTTQKACIGGFERNNRGVCVDINECLNPINPCEQGLICINRNPGFSCEASNCSRGFKPEGRSCIDINECEINPCPMTHNCINTHGSYTCKMKNCPSGYRLDNFGGCEDINECQIYRNNICKNAECINTNGSYECSCNAGFRNDGKHYCRDINECAENIDGCSHECTNTFGGYYCKCEIGYKLGKDQRTCEDIDECRESGGVLCQGECVNTLGSYECRCPVGFRKHDSYCADINECHETPNICNKTVSQCLNTPGSYRCIDTRCKEGYKLLRKNGESNCHLRTPCGDDDYEDECNQPWIYSYTLASRVANYSASNIFHYRLSIHHKYDVIIEDVRAFSAEDSVKKAGFDDFVIHKTPVGFYFATTRPIDGPQDVDIDVLITFYKKDGSIEHKRGVKVKLIVSAFSFYGFNVRK